ILFAASVNLQSADLNVAVERRGKPIQVDGFLVEWDSVTATTVALPEPITWDWQNTSQGLTGYCIINLRDSCSHLVITISPADSVHAHSLVLRSDTVIPSAAIYRIQKSYEGHDSCLILEWLLPWQTLSQPSPGQHAKGTYVLRCTVAHLCSQVPATTVVIRGQYAIQSQSILTPKIRIQIVLLFALLALYIGVRSKTVKKRKKRGNEVI
ncbi:MAG: hypothetical protein JW795_07905, partial [Chitinivibrionales bacterium]|nr:hypothetical protein [Chitinivibrionales bacterium]